MGIKSYTDIKQSRKLAGILPLESADMCYNDGELRIGYTPLAMERDNYLPCWSLAALLSVLSRPDLVQNSDGTWLVRSWVNAYPWSVEGYSNPVDACVAMIERLHKLNLL